MRLVEMLMAGCLIRLDAVASLLLRREMAVELRLLLLLLGCGLESSDIARRASRVGRGYGQRHGGRETGVGVVGRMTTVGIDHEAPYGCGRGRSWHAA